MKKSKKILIVGSIPPPVGGVTVFLKYFSEALRLKGYDFRFYSFSKIFCFDYQVVHINASSSLKRFLLLLFYKALFKRVFFVKHGGFLNYNSLLVKLSLYLADGVFCLNQEVKMQLDKLGVKAFLHSTMFKENSLALKKSYPRNKSSECKILFYINNSSVIDGQEIYGANFFIEAIPRLPKQVKITVVDLSGDYAEKFDEFSNVNYLDHPVDFCMLLSQHDVYVRCTSTDGMSVALLEAGLLGVKCLASDVVTRPKYVNIYKYNDHEDFIRSFFKLLNSTENINFTELTSVEEVVIFLFEDIA